MVGGYTHAERSEHRARGSGPALTSPKPSPLPEGSERVAQRCTVCRQAGRNRPDGGRWSASTFEWATDDRRQPKWGECCADYQSAVQQAASLRYRRPPRRGGGISAQGKRSAALGRQAAHTISKHPPHYPTGPKRTQRARGPASPIQSAVKSRRTRAPVKAST